MRRLLLPILFLAVPACGGGGADDGLASRAEADYPTYRALHESVVTPICGPRGGVCHNSKQFPDLHTPDNMLAAIGQRCNQLTPDPTTILDLCEPQGDLLLIKSGPDAGWSARIGYAAADAPGPSQMLTLTLHDAPAHSGTGLDFSIVRASGAGAGATTTELHVGLDLTTSAGQKSVTVAVAKLSSSFKSFFMSPYVPGYPEQLQAGDPNRNGTFGADLGGAVIAPGAPTKSFLVERILGIVPPRMPLANGTLTDPQIYALECWIAQLKPDGSNADGPIDYARCPAKF
jgi:hypothetical protein